MDVEQRGGNLEAVDRLGQYETGNSQREVPPLPASCYAGLAIRTLLAESGLTRILKLGVHLLQSSMWATNVSM